MPVVPGTPPEVARSPRARVDVVCTAFNRSEAIRPTIDGILAQTLQDWTLTVVSDGSIDDTVDVVRSYRDPRVRVISVERPYGQPGGPRNEGAAMGDAPYISYIDDDDRWTPEHLEVQVDALEGGADLVASGCVRVNEDGSEHDRSGFMDLVWHPELQTLAVMYEPSRVAHVRPMLARVGGWSPGRLGLEDWEMWFRVGRAGFDFTPLPEHTCVMALSAGSRRHRLRAPHAVVLAMIADQDVATRALGEIRRDPAEARARFVRERGDWYAALVGTARFTAPAGADQERIREEVALDYAASGRPSLLEQVIHVPIGAETAVVLPLWCPSAVHAAAIGEVMSRRFPAQLDLLRRHLQS